MNKNPDEILAKVKTILEAVEWRDYNVDSVRNVYDYPTLLIGKYPAITLEMRNCQRQDETLGDLRYAEYYTITIIGYITYLDTRENYLNLLDLDVAIKTTLAANRVVDAYWRNADVPNSDYSLISVGSDLVRRVQLTWIVQNVTIP